MSEICKFIIFLHTSAWLLSNHFKKWFTWDFISGEMKYFQFGIWSISYNYCGHFDRNKFQFGDEMLYNHYPETRTSERKHLRMSVFRQTRDGTPKDKIKMNFISFCLQLGSCLYEKNHLTQVTRLTWVRFQQNGVLHFVETNRYYENGFIPPRWNLTSMQVEFSHRWDNFSPGKQFFSGLSHVDKIVYLV